MKKFFKRLIQILATPPFMLLVIPFTFLFAFATVIAVFWICAGAAFKRNSFPTSEDFESFGLIMLLPAIVFFDVVWETEIIMD